MAPGYPINLNVDGQRCLVLGEGREAEQKAATLEACGALVERRQGYEEGTLSGYFLVVAAGLEKETNARLAAECSQARVLFNCLDDPPNCRFTFPSVLRRGELTLALSTGGACPALAVRLREEFEQRLGEEYGAFLELARAERDDLARKVPAFGTRKALWYRLVDSDILELLREGEEEQARARWREIVEGR